MKQIELIKKSFEEFLKISDCKFVIEMINGDASSRNYYRCTVNELTYIACYDESVSLINFYNSQKVFKQNGILVPELFYYSEINNCTIQEDVGNKTFLKLVSDIHIEKQSEHYKSLIDQIFQIFSIKSDKKSESFYMFNNEFNHEKLIMEVDYTEKYFLSLLFSVKDKRKLEFIREEMSLVCTRISLEKKFIVHRDLHSRNIMVSKEKLVLIDFQDSRWGNYTYDLVSLLEDAYFKISSELKEDLKKYFFNKLSEKSLVSSLTYEKFSYDYNMMAIQRLYKMIGSFSSLKFTKNSHI